MKRMSCNLGSLDQLAGEILATLSQGPDKNAKVVALFGDLGSGKTTFTQFLAKKLGVKDNLTSPTFVLQKNYPVKNHPFFKKLVHIDCYRLNNPEEIITLRWNETLSDPDNLIVIEWPEKISNLLPKDRLNIRFRFVDENTREVEF